jgi:hypothetical protein
VLVEVEISHTVTIKALDSLGVGEGDEGMGGGADRLNSLPEAVLRDIIPLLKTKEGTRTRILGSRWRNLWLSS